MTNVIKNVAESPYIEIKIDDGFYFLKLRNDNAETQLASRHISNDFIQFHFCLKGKWDICHFSSAESDNCFVTSFFKLDVYYNDYFKHFLTKIILPIIDLPNKENIIIDRAYINGHQYGSPGGFHTDGRSSPKNSGPTIMVYINPFWDPRWNGGTLFLKESKTENGENIQNVQVVDFVPGRIVVFEPSIKHCASDISIYSKFENITRFTLAYHTIYKNNC